MKSGSLNLLEPSGPVKACNGIALPLLIHKGMEHPKMKVNASQAISIHKYKKT
jgi:hypothetical protein